ncbi:LysR family transcriptional regulator [Aquimarina sp. BL5]|uniref:LysR family transcriptional regulator n=1 Tax=Aquimarina sp. BL5 TaxID=1714860 RepID=UPI000E554908|nr:LysR family transcriptional regulator [Aquimarina sp. BL5]AXT52920.1 LysR family transcriptional regulator [Aquimarina sp. BL5]RKM93010.1 LysR family transcriptional regulator [Aquimarina sp. BL5]
MINLEWLRTFSKIYECKNITEASTKLNMTQPGVSKHLAALENHIGKKLFERTTRKLTPTEYGRFYYSQIKTPLQELEKVEYYSNQRVKKQRHAITIGCTTDIFRKELRHVIYSFDMYIVTCFGNEKELVEALEADKVQLLVGIKKHFKYDHEFTFFKNEELMIICSNDIEIPEDLKKDEKQLIKWLHKQTWFTFDNEQDDLKKFWETRFNITPKIVSRYILPSYIDIIKSIKHNQGFSIVPKHLIEEELENSTIKTPFEISMSIGQKRFYSYKLKNSNLKEINTFRERMEITNTNNL